MTRRKGHHEAIISLETFHQIEEWKNKKVFAPKRTDIHEDFPLRGAVVCACCEMPMTSWWSRSGTGKLYPYFWCQTRDCSEYRKNIRAEKVEAGFEKVLSAMTPTENVLSVAMSMLSDASSQRDDQTKQAKTALKRQITELGKKQDALVERLIETSNPKVIAALETKIAKLDEDKLRLSDKITQNTKPKASMGQIFELLREFLSNPWNIR